MSENLTAEEFAKRFVEDEAFRNHWTSYAESSEAVSEQLKKEGYTFSTDELGQALDSWGAKLNGELADETLATVSGGCIANVVVAIHKFTLAIGGNVGRTNALLNAGAEVIRKAF